MCEGAGKESRYPSFKTSSDQGVPLTQEVEACWRRKTFQLRMFHVSGLHRKIANLIKKRVQRLPVKCCLAEGSSSCANEKLQIH